MRLKFVAIVSVFLALAGTCFAKEVRKKPVQPVYLHTKSRIKPVFDRPSFEKGNRVRPVREKGVIEKPVFTKKQTELPKFDKDKKDKPDWERSVLETKWQTDTQPEVSSTPTEKKAQSQVKKNWFRKLRDP